PPMEKRNGRPIDWWGEPDDIWTLLAASLEKANGVPRFAPAPLAPAAAAPAGGNSGQQPIAETMVKTVLPSKQSDLAILLEFKRARELCNTIWAAHGDASLRLREALDMQPVVADMSSSWLAAAMNKHNEDLTTFKKVAAECEPPKNLASPG